MSATAELLDQAVENRWCCRWGCTTCGATEFRGRVEALRTAKGDEAIAAEICPIAIAENRDPISFLLRLLQMSMGDEKLELALAGSEGGRLFAAMRTGREIAARKRADHARRNDPDFVTAERARKSESRQAAHEERLAAKSARDAVGRSERQ